MRRILDHFLDVDGRIRVLKYEAVRLRSDDACAPAGFTASEVADRLPEAVSGTIERYRTIAAKLRKAMPIWASNVNRYFQEQLEQTQCGLAEVELGIDRARVVPPFPSLWLEWNTGAVDSSDMSAVGVYVQAHRVEKLPDRVASIAGHSFVETATFAIERPFDWFVFSEFFGQASSDPFRNPFRLGALVYHIDKEGRLVPFPDEEVAPNESPEFYSYQTPMDMNPDNVEDLRHLLWSFSLVMQLTFSFLNCANTELVEKPLTKDRRGRQRRRQRKPDEVRFHILKINPLEVKRRSPSSGTSDVKMPLHICRGHFKDFTEKGLFGRENLKKVFWTKAHERGRTKHGLVDKEYAVEPRDKTQPIRDEQEDQCPPS